MMISRDLRRVGNFTRDLLAMEAEVPAQACFEARPEGGPRIQ